MTIHNGQDAPEGVTSQASCLDVRRMLGISCADTADTFGEHLRDCAPCRDAFEETRRFESRLKTAAQVAPPEGLASRILVAQQFAAAHDEPEQTSNDASRSPGNAGRGAAGHVMSGRNAWRRRRGSLRRIARNSFASAAVLAIVGLLVASPASPLYQRGLAEAGSNYVAGLQALARGEHNKLAREAIAMVHASPYALNARGPAPVASINEALEAIGLQLAGDLGEVRFAGNCLVRQQLAGHIVLEGKHAPVTVFVMPETDAARQGKFADGDWASVVLPAERGSIAVVGAPGESLQAVVDRVQRVISEPRAVQVDRRASIGYYS